MRVTRWHIAGQRHRMLNEPAWAKRVLKGARRLRPSRGCRSRNSLSLPGGL